MCFAWLSEQTAIIPLNSTSLPVFITEAECLLRGTTWVFKSVSSLTRGNAVKWERSAGMKGIKKRKVLKDKGQ